MHSSDETKFTDTLALASMYVGFAGSGTRFLTQAQFNQLPDKHVSVFQYITVHVFQYITHVLYYARPEL